MAALVRSAGQANPPGSEGRSNRVFLYMYIYLFMLFLNYFAAFLHHVDRAVSLIKY